MQMKSRFQTLPWVANLFALGGGILYAIRSWHFAQTQESILDEGAYLLKGFLFAKGTYFPFQDYGPWSNHMPLSFVIPGFIQKIFAPGIRTGRIGAIFFGILVVIGVWIIVRRFSNEWWSAGAVWVLVLNTAAIKMYSVAASQSLAASLLVWALVFALGKSQKLWQTTLGAVLGGILLMTRINLFPVLPLLILYIFWEHGKKAGGRAVIFGAGVVLVIHAIYWPNILKVWAAWSPTSLKPLFAAWLAPKTTPFWRPEVSLESRFISFFSGIRSHFFSIGGVWGSWVLWKHAKDWKDRSSYRAYVFLSILYGVLFLAHAMVSLGRNYCVFCFPVYLSFFQMLGIIATILFLANPPKSSTALRNGMVILFTIALTTGIGYGAFSQIGKTLLATPVPRIRSFQIQSGTVELWGLFANRFGLSYDLLLRLLPGVAGAIVGGLLALIIYLVYKVSARKTGGSMQLYAHILFSAFLLAGFILSPSIYLGGGYATYDCDTSNIIQEYENTGAYLAAVIPAGSRIFWQGTLSAVPLLYLENPRLYPAQINLDYSFRLSGDSEAMEAYGLWNEELARGWLTESDYVLVAERYYKGWLAENLSSSSHFVELDISPVVSTCTPNAYLRVFQHTR